MDSGLHAFLLGVRFWVRDQVKEHQNLVAFLGSIHFLDLDHAFGIDVELNNRCIKPKRQISFGMVRNFNSANSSFTQLHKWLETLNTSSIVYLHSVIIYNETIHIKLTFRLTKTNLWSLIDVPPLMNLYNIFHPGHSYTSPPPTDNQFF